MIAMRKSLVIIFMLLACAAMFAQEQEGRLMRFPDIYKDKVVFYYGGDLWLASTSGGVARRITSGEGRELFPKFSPDGKWIAFTGQYDGNFNVYVMPSDGGQPKQLTFYQGSAHQLNDRMGIHDEVVTWTPDSKRIVFLSRRDASNGWVKRPFTVSIDGGLPTPLPMDQSGLISYSPDGTKIAYNIIFRNFRTWKRYTGGLAQAITIYDFKNNTSEDIPHTDWTDTFPMWHENTIYFTSDRGPEHHLNLYSYDIASKQIDQLTHFSDWDIMWPSLGPDSIVFENAGYLYTYDFQSKQPKKLTIELPADRTLAMKHWENVGRFISDFDVAPDGKRAVFSARGDVFTVPAKEGSVRNLTRTPGIREQKVAWSPDGRWIAYVSDRIGEDEIYIVPQDGLGKEQQITTGHKGFMFAPQWSPDSKKLAWADQKINLWWIDITEKKPIHVDHDDYGEITNYYWSPDSKWLTYDKQSDNNYSVVYVYSLADAKSTAVTSDLNNSYNAMFDPEGKYLYYLSDRDFNEVLGNVDFEFANPKTTRVYVVTLRKDEQSPFGVQSDETAIKSTAPSPMIQEQDTATDFSSTKASKKDEAKNNSGDEDSDKNKDKDKEKNEKPVDVKIDVDGIQDRVVALPMDPAVIRAFAAAKGYLYYSTAPIQGLDGPISGEGSEVHAYDLKDRKEKTLIEGVERFALSFDGSKLLYESEGGGGQRAAHTYGIIDAKPADQPKKVGDNALSLNGMRAEIDPPAEWKQMYNEVWRQERDYFYEPEMNGVDWQKMHDKYAQLLPYVSDRYSLTYIMGELIGELSNSHTYVGGGDYPDLHPVNVGLLGVDYDLDPTSGMYRFKKIYPGENWNQDLRSPLTEPGINVKEGDYLLAVNGRQLRAPQDPYELFVNTANETVTLTVNSKPSDEGSHNVIVKPINDEYNLRELDMINTNRKKVDEATGGKVGYIYLPDMGAPGLDDFVKQFFPQIRKQGLIIDVRYNGGGFVDELIFERLRRILAGMDSARNWKSGTVPPIVFNGSMVCLTNHYAASDGDIFSYTFKYYKLGPLIGERTWGGVRGIRGDIPLMDGGYITRPEFSRYNLDSQWIIENHGVQPDIVVENRPEQVISGKDPQLDRAIEEVMKEIQANPKQLPPRPPALPPYPAGPG